MLLYIHPPTASAEPKIELNLQAASKARLAYPEIDNRLKLNPKH